MRPKTLSASALKTASLCMRRYQAEYIQFGRGMQNFAAGIGTAVHGALELYVQAVYVKKEAEPSIDLLQAFYYKSFQDTFSSSDTESEEYKDGSQLLHSWFDRTSFKGIRVLTTEQKKRYPIPLSDGTKMPLTYIFDRHDVEEETGEHTVVDYKTNRAPMSPAELKTNIQARIYALIIQIMHPELERVWVSFDMLRHDGPTTVMFTKADNMATWHWITGEIGRILAVEKPEATLNPECGYCVLKTRCPKILDNIKAGGVFGMTDVELVDQRVKLEAQAKAAKTALEELDSVLEPKLRLEDGISPVIEGTEYRAFVSSGKQRAVDSEMVERAVPEIFPDYVQPSKLTLGVFDKLLKDERLTPEQIKILKSLVRHQRTRPTIKLEKIL